MAQVNVNISISMDEGLQREAEVLFNRLGLDMASAVNVFIKQAVLQQRIPFADDGEDTSVYAGGNAYYLQQAKIAEAHGQLQRHELLEDWPSIV
jgi:addiction module RelB/DinJ family antitoxin